MRVFAHCSLNGRKPQLLIDPTVDLTQENLPPNWIVPLEAEMGADWYEPIETWEELVMKDPNFRTTGLDRKKRFERSEYNRFERIFSGGSDVTEATQFQSVF